MKNEDAMIQLLKEISERQSEISRKQTEDKKEILDKISSVETNSNLHFSNITNILAHERARLDEVYDSRKQVEIKFSRAFVGLNAIFAGMVAMITTLFSIK